MTAAGGGRDGNRTRVRALTEKRLNHYSTPTLHRTRSLGEDLGLLTCLVWERAMACPGENLQLHRVCVTPVTSKPS